MKTDHILMCVVALILGMLLANMFKNVCGCRTVEGSSDPYAKSEKYALLPGYTREIKDQKQANFNMTQDEHLFDQEWNTAKNVRMASVPHHHGPQ
jgi:hypothetical protein